LDELAKQVATSQPNRSLQTKIIATLEEEHMTIGDFVTYCAEQKKLQPMPFISKLTASFESVDEWNFNQRSLEFLLPDLDTHTHLANFFIHPQTTKFQSVPSANRKALRDAYAVICKRKPVNANRPEDEVFAESIRENFIDVFYDQTASEGRFLFDIRSNIPVTSLVGSRYPGTCAKLPPPQMAFALLLRNRKPDTLKLFYVDLDQYCSASPLDAEKQEELLKVSISGVMCVCVCVCVFLHTWSLGRRVQWGSKEMGRDEPESHQAEPERPEAAYTGAV
jgi:hypothetical protein